MLSTEFLSRMPCLLPGFSASCLHKPMSFNHWYKCPIFITVTLFFSFFHDFFYNLQHLFFRDFFRYTDRIRIAIRIPNCQHITIRTLHSNNKLFYFSHLANCFNSVDKCVKWNATLNAVQKSPRKSFPQSCLI